MSPDTELLLSMYHKILLIRRFEETGMEKYHEKFVHGYFHTYIGQEAVAVGACSALHPEDYITSTHRGHGHCIAKGADLRRMMAELYGKVSGYARGRGGSMHISDRVTGNIGANGIVGAGIALAVGVGMGIRQEKSDRVVVCFFGDGASNNGVFAESLNLAAIYHLPVIFLLENNCYAATTPVRKTALCEQLSDRGCGYGIPGKSIFGNDPVEVYQAVREARERARSGQGPALIEARTYRYYGHHVRDAGAYMDRNDLEYWKSRDPLDITAGRIHEAGVDEAAFAGIEKEVEREIAEAVEFAETSPDPSVEEFLAEVGEMYSE